MYSCSVAVVVVTVVVAIALFCATIHPVFHSIRLLAVQTPSTVYVEGVGTLWCVVVACRLVGKRDGSRFVAWFERSYRRSCTFIRATLPMYAARCTPTATNTYMWMRGGVHALLSL